MPSVNKKSRPWKPKLKRQYNSATSNTSKYKKFYDSKAWRQFRLHWIQAHPLCKHCREDDKLQPGAHVDHIKPISQGGDKLSSANVQTLCVSCHSIKTLQDRRKYGY